ncbi:hypothetical protein ACVOMV_15860 [Mesorhizobium atlanticum]
MSINLHGRSVLSLDGLSADEIRFLLKLAADLKAAKQAGHEIPRLIRKNIALYLRRTRRARGRDSKWPPGRGRHVTYFGPSGSRIGHKGP